ncbi:hypothetical protein KBK19_16770 [Microvirga sp. STR05]|uniref:Uncharacterized protein n=1 Tax=Hymenobacter duratus TaxID=2771356 RepID=A0ABR8JIM8_9BACT|nr:hypothetical protein [Hymenobacter duratus]MBD2716700.1 hypothetical protein [Hymenobacter duratus]MBR7951615.1 hypothetical protein [Microvirga sp. STR05]
MKRLPIFSYPVAALLCCIISACNESDAKKQDDPKPTATQHTVQVRYSGANIEGLGARISGAAISTDGQTVVNNFDTLLPEANVSDVLSIGQVLTVYEFSTTISFENLRTARAPLNSYLEADILVDGLVKRSIRIDHATAPGTTFVTAKATIKPDSW